jgi:hypothetical protein
MKTLAWRSAAGEIRVELACSQNITPLTETVVPCFPGKVNVPTPVIQWEQPSVATLKGMGDDRVLNSE